MASRALERDLASVQSMVERGFLSAEEGTARRALILQSTAVSFEPQDESYAVLGFGLAGAVAGVFFAFIALMAGSVANGLDGGSGNQVIGLGISALLAAMVGGVLAGLHHTGNLRTWTGAGLLIAAVWHLVSISIFAVPGAALMALAGAIALIEQWRK